MTRYLVPFAIALLAIPLISSARTLPDVGSSAPNAGEVLGASTQCPNLYRSLSMGMRGQDVVELQNFLISNGYLQEGNNSGYFGRLTKAAVIDFQSEQGLPATGFVGPMTRAAITRVCGGGGTTASAGFTAYPKEGSAPLTVNFSYPGSNAGSYSIEYGDGASEAVTLIQTPCLPGANCPGYYGSSHTYTSPGTYNARLTKYDPNSCYQLQTYPPQTRCGGNVAVASVTITVSGGTTGISCTSDSQCPASYMCEALEGYGTACAVSSTGQTDPNCTSQSVITKGVCKLRAGSSCSTSADCATGTLCHAGVCTNPVGRTCAGTSDSSCGTGWQCIQDCGGPVSNQYDAAPGYHCMLNEQAAKPRNCPICLAGSSLIDTPLGSVQVKDLQKGMPVWTTDSELNRIQGLVTATSRIPVSHHTVVHLVLSDGRSVFVSAGHPTSDGRLVGDLAAGDSYDGTVVMSADRVPYTEDATYDLLPSGSTGFYWADGILLGSTLK